MKPKTLVYSFIGMIFFCLMPRVSFTAEDIGELVRDMPRHDSWNYITWGTLPDAWFMNARNALKDPFLYIVLSDTGSAASKLIGMFTRVPYNHVSLACDRNLETLVSYNGGGGIHSPGLNREQKETLCRKPDASLVVFKLAASPGQKARILRRIEEINRQGSS